MRFPRASLVAAVLLASVAARAQTPAPATSPATSNVPPAGASALTLGPYVQDLRADGFTVVCETGGDHDVDVTLTAPGKEGLHSAKSHGHHHELTLHGLVPASRVPYRLRVGDVDAGGGEVQLVDAGKPITFLVYGDTRNGEAEGAALTRLARSLTPAFALFTGDVATSGADGDSWLDFFTEEAPLLRDVPLFAAVGNHEIFRDPEARLFRGLFALPDHGRERLYYRFAVGPLAFIVLDGNDPTQAQTDWLAAALDATEHEGARHVFVLLHQPPFSVGTHCGAAIEQAAWVELFERHRVRAVFAGHDHAYERMERNGVRYFVSGGGGAPLYAERADCHDFDSAAKRVYRSAYHLLRVTVDGDRVDVTALPLDDGPPIDAVRFAAGEPPFATEGQPPLDGRAHPELGQPKTSPRKLLLLGALALAFVLFGFVVRRKR